MTDPKIQIYIYLFLVILLYHCMNLIFYGTKVIITFQFTDLFLLTKSKNLGEFLLRTSSWSCVELEIMECWNRIDKESWNNIGHTTG